MQSGCAQWQRVASSRVLCSWYTLERCSSTSVCVIRCVCVCKIKIVCVRLLGVTSPSVQ